MSTRLALAQLPKPLRHGRQTLIRTDSAGGTHAFLDWLPKPDRWLSYPASMTITDAIHQAALKIPKKAWTPACDAGGTERPGAWAAEITDMPDLSTWPKDMRLIVRKERPARTHRPPPLAPLHHPMALDQRDHQRHGPAPGPAEPRLTSHVDRPNNPQ